MAARSATDARALVLDRDAVVLHQDRNGAASVTQRVVEQDPDHLADEARGGDHVVHAARRHHHLAALLGETVLPVGHLMVHERRQIEFGALLRRSRPRHGEQVIECQVQLVGLRQRRSRLSSDLGVVVALQEFEPHGDAGETGAQLVRGVGGESAF